jgi:Flp pilus assembly protein TadG
METHGLSFPRRQRQRGSAALEAAFVFLPLMAILFALMDFSVAIFVKNVLYHAVREGVRFAVTQQTGAMGQDAAIKSVVQTNAMGFLNGGGGLAYISVNYYDSKTGALAVGARSNGAGNICVVSVTAFPWIYFAPVWRSAAASFSATSSDAMESPPNGVLPTR